MKKYLIVLVLALFPFVVLTNEVPYTDSSSMYEADRPLLYREIITGKVLPDGSVREIERHVIPTRELNDVDRETPSATPTESSIKARIGVEDRVDVSSNTYPYSAVARVVFSSDDGNFSCTGWRAGRRIMMTNGHCVWDKNKNKFHWNNRADFGYNNGTFKQREYPVLLVVSKWYQEGKSGVDWGMYVLRADVPNYTGWFGTKNYNTAWNNGSYWRLSGYGSNMTGHPFSTEFQTANLPLCKVTSVVYSGNALFNDCDSGQGSSGSPLYGYWNGTPYAVGLNYAGFGPRDDQRMNSCSPMQWGVCGNLATKQNVFVPTLIDYLSKYP